MLGLSPIRLWHVIRKECKQLLRDPKARPLILGSPILQFILLAYASTTDVENIRTMVVDQDRSAAARDLIQAYQATGYFRFVTAERPEQIAGALDRGDIMVGIVIPPGFSRDLGSGRGARVQALIDGSDASVATVAQSYVAQVAAKYGATATGIIRPGNGVELRARAWFNPGLESRLFNVPAIMGTLLLFTGMMLTTMGVVREREVGTLDQLLVSPVQPAELMLGKMAPVLLLGIFHLLLFTGITLFYFGVPFRGSFAVLGLASLLFILASLGIGLLISAVSRTQQEAFMLMVMIMLPLVLLSGFLSAIDTLPAAFQQLTLANPIRHYLDILRSVYLKGTGVGDMGIQFGALATIAGGTLLLATSRFRGSIG